MAKPKLKYLSFNLNDSIRFRLTSTGLKMHRKEWDDLNALSGGAFGRAYPYEPPKVDKDGYSEDQAWCVLETYGSGFHMGAVEPFGLTIQINAKDLSPVKRVRARRAAR